MPADDELLALLHSIGDNAVNLRALVLQVRSDPGVTPFVGAGMSVPFEFKAWKDFLLEQAPDPATRAKVETYLADGRYEEAAEELFLVRGENAFQAGVDAAFGPHRLVGKPLAGAVMHLPRLASGPVLTTNFDGVLEAVFKGVNAPFEEVVLGMKLDKIRDAFHRKRRVLIKLHGDATDRTDRVFTLGDYQRNYGDVGDGRRHPLRTVLEFAMHGQLLFLGCSLKQDRTMRVLETLARDRKALIRHYAVLEQPDGDELARRQQYFTELGVWPIWYPPTRHDLIEPLLGYLARQAEEGAAETAARKQPLRPILSQDLPRPPATWVGRAPEEKRVVEALQTAHVVVIEGPRGSGKTALALRAIDRFVRGGRFGAIVWTSAKARALSLPELLDAISFTFDFPHTVQLPMPRKETALLEELQRKGVPCLIVIDNYETITDPGVADFVNARLPANSAVLITSSKRVPLGGDGVTIVPLDELPEAEAGELFRRRTADSGLEEVSQADFRAFFELVGGRPLAIELAVGQMRGEEAKELGWIVEDLRAGTGDIFEDLIRQAWKSLPEAARVVLCGLSLFATDATEPALTSTCGLPTAAFREGVQKLRLLYLLRQVRPRGAEAEGGPRYAVHPLTREFARRRLPELGVEDDLFHRAGQYYLELVKEHGGSPDKESSTDLRTLNAERSNIFAFLESSFERQNHALFLDLADTLSRWLFIGGLWEHLDAWTGKVVAVAAARNHRAAGRMMNELGRVRSYRAEYQAAEDTFAKALELARAAHDPAGVASVFHHHGECRIRQNSFDEAERLLTRSLEQFEAIRSLRDCIGVRYRLADLAYKRGHFAKARALFTRGVQETEDAKWERLEAYHRNFLGDLAARENDLAEARYQYERARQLVPETDTRRLALLEYSLAQLEQRADRLPRALDWAGKARDHFRKLGMRQEAEDADRLVLNLTAEAGG